MTGILAVITLLGAWPSFKYPRVSRLSCHMKEAFLKEACCITALRDIYHHGAICLRFVFLTQPSYLRYCCFILLAKCLGRSGPDASIFIQNR